MRLLPFIASALLITSASIAHSHDCDTHPHDRGHNHEVFKEKDGVPLSEEQKVNNLMVTIHEAMDAKASEQKGIKAFFVNWLDRLNFRKAALSGYRWYQVNSGTNGQSNHAANLTLVFVASHALEVASGPIATSAAIANDLPAWATTAIAAAGTAISVPGLDPMCLLLFAIYPIPQVHKNVNKFRLGILKLADKGSSAVGIKSLLKQYTDLEAPIITLHEAIEASDQSKGQYKIRSSYLSDDDSEEGKQILEFFNEARVEPLLTLEFEESTDTTFSLKKVEIAPAALESGNIAFLEDSLGLIHWNARDAVLGLIKDLKASKLNRQSRLYHVESISTDAESGKITATFKDLALRWPNARVRKGEPRRDERIAVTQKACEAIVTRTRSSER